MDFSNRLYFNRLVFYHRAGGSSVMNDSDTCSTSSHDGGCTALKEYKDAGNYYDCYFIHGVPLIAFNYLENQKSFPQNFLTKTLYLYFFNQNFSSK
jgi:hypothetical protein